MAAETVDAGSGHPVLAGLALVERGLDQVLAASTWSLDDRQLGAAIVRLTQLAARTEAARAAVLRESVSRETPDARGEQGARTVNLLRSRCRVAGRRASADVANAKLTCPDTGTLRGLGAALAAGAVSRATLHRLPGRVVRERRHEVDALLTEHAKAWDPGTAEQLSRHLLSVVAPDRADRYDENALERRHLGVIVDSTGMVLLNGQLDPVGGLTVATLIDHYVERDRAAGGADVGDDGDGDAAVDLRTRGQRRADALVQMARAAAEHDGLGAAARAVPRVVVITTPEQLAGADGAGAATTTDGTLVDRGTLTRIACDAVIDRVVLSKKGRVLAMDTLGRLATPAQQTALAARDLGCTWPGCTTPPSLCEAHHVLWWSRGGPTSLDNLALLCHRHHTQVHAQPDEPGAGWQMIVCNGLPWFRPPDRLDPAGRLQRNTFHQTVEATRRTGLHWRTGADDLVGLPGPDPDPP